MNTPYILSISKTKDIKRQIQVNEGRLMQRTV